MKSIAIKSLIFIFLLSVCMVSAESVLAQENQIKDVIKLVMPATVLVVTYDAKGKPLVQGSGFFVSEKGEFITNYHVFKDAESIEVKCQDNSVYKITLVIAEDMTSDLVKLQADTGGKKVPWLRLNKTKIEVGEKIVVIGSPEGLEATVSDGIVSAVRDVPGFGNIIQITAPISPGSSGSAVVNMKGEVIGVASAQMRDGQNLNFVVPAEKITVLKDKKQAIAASKPKGAEKQSDDIYSAAITDIDGNVYKTVKIGNQVWMAENLRTTKYQDGSAIPLVTDKDAWIALKTPGYCYYENTTDVDNIKKYGALYNWYAVDTKKLAPKGWHVPTDVDWTILENYLISNGYNWDGTKMGNKIAKSMTAKTDWQTHTTPGAPGNDLTKNNRSGFSALPGGFRGAFGYFDLFGYGHWWSATEVEPSGAYNRNLGYDLDNLYGYFNYKSCGFSVRLLRDVEKQSDDIYSAALAYYLKEDYEKALSLFKQHLQNNKNSSEAWFYVGVCCAELGRYEEAIEAYKQAIKLKPDYVQAYVLQGVVLSKLGHYGEAIEACKQAIKMKSDYVYAYSILGVVFSKVSRYEEAIEAYKQAIMLKPGDAESHFMLGSVYGESGHWQEAIEAYKQAIMLKPGDAESHFMLGLVFVIIEDNGSALEEYKILKRLDPKSANDLLNQIEGADKTLESLDAGAYFKLGNAHAEAGRYQEAIEAYKQAIRLKPDDAEMHYNLGNAYGKSGHWQEAIEAYKQAIRLKPDDAKAHYNLGIVYAGARRWQQAIDAYEQAIRLIPDDAEAHNYLGVAYLNSRRWQEAIEAFKRAIKLEPDDAEAHFNLGMAYILKKDKRSALEEYKILKKLDPESANMLFNFIYK